MSKVLVTGGAGFIGSHTVVELLEAGHSPVIVDNFSNSEKKVLEGIKKITDSEVACYTGDYQDKNLIATIIENEDIDSVIHFAAFKAVSESVEQPIKYYQNNVAGFLDLLDVLLRHKVYNFVFSSSAAVYGNPPTELVTEETAVGPVSPYGWSKYMDEVMLQDVCSAESSLKGVALRYFNVVGGHESAIIGELPKGRPQNLLPIIVQATTGQIEPLTIFGDDYPTADGTCLRDYIHVVDLAKAHIKALEKILKRSEGGYAVYDIGTGKPTSVKELIDTFERVNKVTVPHTIGQRRLGDPISYFASAEKAKRELGWSAEKNVEDAVRDAWRWQQKQTTKT